MGDSNGQLFECRFPLTDAQDRRIFHERYR